MVASLIARLPAVCRVIGPVVDMHKHARSMEVIARHAETKARIQAGSPGAASEWVRAQPRGCLEVVYVVPGRFPRLLLPRRRRLSTKFLCVIVARHRRRRRSGRLEV